jgi:hypothetical protein
MKASDLQVGDTCRHEDVGCVRIAHVGTDVALITVNYELRFVDPDTTVWAAFQFEGPDQPEGDRDLSRHICGCIDRAHSLRDLNIVHTVWEARMKELAAAILRPDSEETITDLYALDYIWGLHGDYSITGDQVYHPRALDYYLGRYIEHIWGGGVLMRIMTAEDYETNFTPKDRAFYTRDRVFLSNPGTAHPLPARNIDYGIRLDYPCSCGHVLYEMFAIPGVHTGGFAYLVTEDSPHYLDVRNQCRVCPACEPVVRTQLEAIKRGVF